jgi:3',5'-cyclic AMP phosphodiesterase CpdA
MYAESYPGLFYSQTSWIVLNKKRLDIKYVLQLGDITNRNTREQWKVARESMSLLHGVVPYAIAPGNHDFGPGGNAKTRETFFNEYFPFEEEAAMPTFGGAYRRGQLENTYHLFEAGGRKWIVISLEWGPRDSVVDWAKQVMTRHKDRTGILITHAYVYSDSTRYDWKQFADHQHWNPYAYGTEGGVNDGEDLWQKLVKRHNFAFALNGHVLNDGTGYVASKNDLGLTVHQVLANYQFRTLGGEGYLRILEFSPNGRTVRIKAYSTLYDRFMTAADQSFVVSLDQSLEPATLDSLKFGPGKSPRFEALAGMSEPRGTRIPVLHSHSGRTHTH